MTIICTEREQEWLIAMIAEGCRGCNKDITCEECIKEDPDYNWIIEKKDD